MQKILTIFDRDWNGKRGVINKYINDDIPRLLSESIATEKLDGTNVRLTIRNKTLVRLEKRCNPSKVQKNQGIEDPWYVDADENNPSDKYIWEAARNTDLSIIPDGEWSAEALGPKIQGNPLGLINHTCCIFSAGQAPIKNNVPHDYDGLAEYLIVTQSSYGDGKIEGIVWHHPSGSMLKIKHKDFK